MKKTFKEVNKELGLEVTSEWGIINGDANRVKEFLDYLIENKGILDKPTKFDFCELVISSMNEAILEKKVDDELKFLFKEYIYSNLDNETYVTLIMEYWAHYANEEEMPVGFLLREILDYD